MGSLPDAVTSPRQQAYEMRKQGMNFVQNRANQVSCHYDTNVLFIRNP